jgi:murein L,D-transpeptidase YcbB/YkuD
LLHYGGEVMEMADLEAEMQQIATAKVIDGGFPKANGSGPPPPPLSPSRSELQAAIARLAVAQREVDEATKPLHRLHAVETEAERMSAELLELMKRDMARTGEWIANGRVGPDPGDAADTVELNAAILGKREELAGCRSVLPTYQATHLAAVEKLRAASNERDAAVATVITAEIALKVAEAYVASLNQALIHEAQLRSLADAVKLPDGTHTHTTNTVTALIGAAQRSAGAVPDPAFGRDMIAALSVDPAHGLER